MLKPLPQYNWKSWFINTTAKRSFGQERISFFENKDIRAASKNISRSDSSTAIYSSLLYTNNKEVIFLYFLPDINGNYVVKT
jgi:hypothetical protein